MKIALVHDWLTGMRGGEKVLEVLCDLFPKADLFTLVHAPGQVSPTIERHRIFTSPLQRLPQVRRYYRHLLPLMPWAIQQFDFIGYDVIISTSHCVAKGAIPRGKARHVCYCHTPMRYIWDQFEEYFGPGRSSILTRGLMHLLRQPLQQWDLRTVPRVHTFIANSQNVRERIQRIYHRDSQVIYPPVDHAFFSQGIENVPKPVEPFYLIVSALAPYKRIDLAIETFKQSGKKLVIIGEGQESAALQNQATPNIQFLGWMSNDALRSHYQQARALIFPGEEDFGIVPLEAMSAGCPVIAFRKGGALETVAEKKTGLFFDRQTSRDLMTAIESFEQTSLDRNAIRSHAERFSRDRCEQAFRSLFIEYRAEMS
ncbi:MAG: glycosyltransferase [Elusimicrobiota bacterium]|jgi:glycosyltransferase involved in cell wall biosynthesis